MYAVFYDEVLDCYAAFELPNNLQLNGQNNRFYVIIELGDYNA